jgi:anti-sigma regulatory factor (Ser/Thr protein kinase)
MERTKSRENPAIRQFILENVVAHPHDIATLTAKKFGTSRVTANRYLKKLVDEGYLAATGATKARKYTLRQTASAIFAVHVDKTLEEDVVYRERVEPLLRDVPANVKEICQYGFTEMLNNVIDHSESEECWIVIERTANRIDLTIRDYGVGIFNKIQKECGLNDPRHALLELSKGKLTTDPARHSGEGIFFTSRMFTEFTISSGDLFYNRELERDEEWLIEVQPNIEPLHGTSVKLQLDINIKYTALEVFRQYEDEDRGFAKTHVPVRLAKYGDEQLVSRSQARRVLARFNKFTEILLDFDGVSRIGQAFADEIFRVYWREHPEVSIIPIRITPEVEEMISHVRNAARELSPAGKGLLGPPPAQSGGEG